MCADDDPRHAGTAMRRRCLCASAILLAFTDQLGAGKATKTLLHLILSQLQLLRIKSSIADWCRNPQAANSSSFPFRFVATTAVRQVGQAAVTVSSATRCSFMPPSFTSASPLPRRLRPSNRLNCLGNWTGLAASIYPTHPGSSHICQLHDDSCHHGIFR